MPKLTRHEIIARFDEHSEKTVEYSVLNQFVIKQKRLVKDAEKRMNALADTVNKQHDDVADALDKIDPDWRTTICEINKT